MTPWRRNLYLIWAGQIITISGFNICIPFLPFLLVELGVEEPTQLKTWVGWLSAAPPLGMLVSAPIWGLLGDRFGRKLMLMRSLFAGSLILALTSLVQHPWQLFTLRLIQGVFTGTVAAAITLVAAATPPRQSAMALGLLATSQYIGITIGPSIGGLAVNLFGPRPTFWGSSLLLFTSGILVLRKVEEIQAQSHDPQLADDRSAAKKDWLPTLVWLSLAYLAIQFGKMAVNPYLPLMIAYFFSGLNAGAAGISGLILGLNGLAGAAGSLLLGRWLGHRADNLRPALFLVLFTVLIQVSLFYLGRKIGGLVFGLIVFSFISNGIEPLINSCIARSSPVSRRGLVFGFGAQARALGWLGGALAASQVSRTFDLPALFLLAAAGSLAAIPFLLFVKKTI